jgi:hypothetical protein
LKNKFIFFFLENEIPSNPVIIILSTILFISCVEQNMETEYPESFKDFENFQNIRSSNGG